MSRFTVHRSYRDRYPTSYDGPLFDWPAYRPVEETPEQIAEARRNYAALLSKCDASLGDILDAFDAYDLWQDTMLILWTDHGYLLGEHNAWAKNWMPLYEEVSHTPFFLWDPRAPEAAGTRRRALVQPAIDLGPTLLGLFGLERTPDMLGHDLAGTVAGDHPVRESAIFGYFDQHVNITDGRYVHLRLPAAEAPRADAYTLMPTAMRGFKGNLERAELAPPFPFSKQMSLLKVDGTRAWEPAFPDPAHMRRGTCCSTWKPIRASGRRFRTRRWSAGWRRPWPSTFRPAPRPPSSSPAWACRCINRHWRLSTVN